MTNTLFVFLLILTCATGSFAQNPFLVTLEIDVKDGIGYETDTYEYEKFATMSGEVPRKLPTRTFADFTILYDVVAVNGQPVKGAMVFRSHRIAMSPNAAPGQSIGDITRGTIGNWAIEILNPDGTQIGSLMMSGFPNGDPPPGTPFAATTHNMAITGGTGMFLGARGYFGGTQRPFSISNAGVFRSFSVTADPSQRRGANGGAFGHVAQFAPLFRPIVREILHANLTPVTSANPARRGEVVILRASGLGPAKGVVLGQSFPEAPLAEVTSPVEASVGGRQARVVNKVGWPGATDEYRIDFEVPDSAQAGAVPLRLTCGWISAAEVTIPIQ